MMSVVRNNDTDELLGLIELVVGVASMCEDRARFIQAIFSLSGETQFVLKDLIERNMSRLVDVDAPAGDSSSATTADSHEVARLREERARLLNSVASLESANAALEGRVDALSEELAYAQAAASSRTDVAATESSDAVAVLQQQV